MSLKDILHNLIKQRGEVSYGQVCQLCAEEGYKSETATRRLREMTDIEPVIAKSKRGTNYISGYKWIGEPVKHETVSTAPQGLNFVYQISENNKTWKL